MKSSQINENWISRYSTLWLLLLPIIIGGAIVNLFFSPLIVSIYTYFCINLVMVVSLQIFMGNSGILAWTHVGFIGIGAYASSICSVAPSIKQMGVPNMYPFLVQIQLPVTLSILIGAIVAALVAALIAWPLMHLSDAVGIITIYATLIVMHVVMTQWDNVTNGPRTFFGVQPYTTLWVAIFGAVLTILIAFLFRESSLGIKLRASRDDRIAATAIGINVVKVRYFSFILSALLAGFAGGLWAHFITSFSPKSFYVAQIFLLLTMLVIGGSGSVSGAVAGTAIVTIIREFLRQFENYLNNASFTNMEFFGITEIILAIAMIGILALRPMGIVGGKELTLSRISNLIARKPRHPQQNNEENERTEKEEL